MLFHANCLLRDEMPKPIFGENKKKNIINVSSAKFVHRLVYRGSYMSGHLI